MKDAFIPGPAAGGASFDDHFGDDVSSPFCSKGKQLNGVTSKDDNFGPLSDSAAANDSEPFSLPGAADDVDDGSFETFGDFGDFHSGDGDLTPTGDSWTFASDTSLSSGSDDAEVDDAERDHHIEKSDLDNVDEDRTLTERPS